VALVVTRHVLVVLASAALMAGTVIGFILVRAGTLFGFHLPFTSGLAAFVLVVEIVAVVLLAATADHDPAAGGALTGGLAARFVRGTI
jgi:hypothetical protein